MTPASPQQLQTHVTDAAQAKHSYFFDPFHVSRTPTAIIPKKIRKNTKISLDKTQVGVYNNKADFGDAGVT